MWENKLRLKSSIKTHEKREDSVLYTKNENRQNTSKAITYKCIHEIHKRIEGRGSYTRNPTIQDNQKATLHRTPWKANLVRSNQISHMRHKGARYNAFLRLFPILATLQLAKTSATSLSNTHFHFMHPLISSGQTHYHD